MKTVLIHTYQDTFIYIHYLDRYGQEVKNRGNQMETPAIKSSNDYYITS